MGTRRAEANHQALQKEQEVPAKPEMASAAAGFIREVVDLSTDPATKALIDRLDTDPSPVWNVEGGIDITDLAGNPWWYEVDEIRGTGPEPLMKFTRIRKPDQSFSDTVTYRKGDDGKFTDVTLKNTDKTYNDAEQRAKLSQIFPGLDESQLQTSMGMFENGGFGTVNHGPYEMNGKKYQVNIDVVGRVQVTKP